MSSSASPSTSVSSKKVVLTSSDGQSFEVDEAVAMESQTIKQMKEEVDGSTNDGFPLPNVHSQVLSKVIEYCKKHADTLKKADEEVTDNKVDEGLKKWDEDFIKREAGDKDAIFDLILAANYLNIKNLLDLTCQSVAHTIKDMKVEDVREYFNIENDFTPDEEAEIRKQHQWAFE